ncbi:MAG: hypothetical protein HFJ38_06345 [Bacilli bacterium]|nr:hypothetical protein [Bacilli bacterium]
MKKYNKLDNTTKICIYMGILLCFLTFISIKTIQDFRKNTYTIQTPYKNTNNLVKKNNIKKMTNGNQENKIYFINNISILTPNKIADEFTLQMDKLKINETLSKYIGKNTDYFLLYLAKENKKLNIKNTPMLMTIKIDSNRKFEGIYKIINKKEVERLPYYKKEDNMIEVEIQELGRYAIKYEEELIDIKEELEIVSHNLNNEKTWGIILLTILSIGFVYYIIISIKNKLHIRTE